MKERILTKEERILVLETQIKERALILHADISTIKKRYAKAIKLLKSNSLNLSVFLI